MPRHRPTVNIVIAFDAIRARCGRLPMQGEALNGKEDIVIHGVIRHWEDVPFLLPKESNKLRVFLLHP